MSMITPCLWFDGAAEEAARFYVSLLPNSSIDRINPYLSKTPSGEPGETMTVEFTLNGQPFVGLNGGPMFKFTEAISFTIPCKDQAEVDRLWSAILANGGKESVCGWIYDKWGLAWQIIPDALVRLSRDPDPATAKRVFDAIMKMVKIDVAALEKAARG
jgi:predicted 3-demethylubiquinone-9 3-methyltransferase (glyoxalase superfamily)